MARWIRLVLGSVAAGAVLGLVGRLAMRFVAREAGLPGSFSWGGSSEVVLFGVILGAPVALGFWLARSRIPIRRPYAGALLGTALLGVLALIPPGPARSALQGTPDTPAATTVTFLIGFVLWGIGLDLGDPRPATGDRAGSVVR